MKRGAIVLFSALMIAGGLQGSAAAQALSMKECSEKYNAAKAANTLNGQGWNDFRKAHCSAGATAAAPEAKRTEGAAPRQTAPAGKVVFPTSVNPKFASEKAHVQRQKTCSEQWQANKSNGGNGDMKWIQKGGGYWSECNKRLKGQTGA